MILPNLELVAIIFQKATYAADRESTDLLPFLERPVTVMYPYESLEDMEPWLFVPGNYNGRIELFGRSVLLVRHA